MFMEALFIKARHEKVWWTNKQNITYMQKEYYWAIKRMKFYDLPQPMIGMGNSCANWINADTEKELTHIIGKFAKALKAREVQSRVLVAECWRYCSMGRRR